MRISTTIIAFACCIASWNAIAAAANDQDRLYGVWNVERLERNGSLSKDGDGGKFIIQKATATLMGLAGEYHLNDAAEPKEIDFKSRDGSQLRGIYKIDGKTLIVCLAMSSKPPRPTGFSTKSNDGCELMVLSYSGPPTNWTLSIGAPAVVVAIAVAGWFALGGRRNAKSKLGKLGGVE